MYKVLAINHDLRLEDCEYRFCGENDLPTLNPAEFDFLIVSGGDGLLRRTVAWMHRKKTKEDQRPAIVFNPKGTGNIFAKIRRCMNIRDFQAKLKKRASMNIEDCPYYQIGNEVFVFSAGNSFDLRFIQISERIRTFVGGFARYLLGGLLVFPLLAFLAPALLFRKTAFFVFHIGKKAAPNKIVAIKNTRQWVQLDGDLAEIQTDSGQLTLQRCGTFPFVAQGKNKSKS